MTRLNRPVFPLFHKQSQYVFDKASSSDLYPIDAHDNDNDNDKQFIFRHVCPYNIK